MSKGLTVIIPILAAVGSFFAIKALYLVIKNLN